MLGIAVGALGAVTVMAFGHFQARKKAGG